MLTRLEESELFVNLIVVASPLRAGRLYHRPVGRCFTRDLVNVRPENERDINAIEKVISSAFEKHPYSNHREQFIVSQLRVSSALSVSLVAEYDEKIIGHISFSIVKINGEECFWYGLAPVSVSPEHQKSGVGSQLIRAGLEAIKGKGARGCVLLGEPEYYEKFGFKAMDSLVLEGVPPELFLCLCFDEFIPTGKVEYHQSFADNG